MSNDPGIMFQFNPLCSFTWSYLTLSFPVIKIIHFHFGKVVIYNFETEAEAIILVEPESFSHLQEIRNHCNNSLIFQDKKATCDILVSNDKNVPDGDEPTHTATIDLLPKKPNKQKFAYVDLDAPESPEVMRQQLVPDSPPYNPYRACL